MLVKLIWLCCHTMGSQDAPLAQALGDITGAILNVLPTNGIVLRGDVASSLSTMSLCEGLVMQLDSNYDILANIVPYFIRFRGWASMEEIATYGYSTSERETKDLKQAMSQTIDEALPDLKQALPDLLKKDAGSTGNAVPQAPAPAQGGAPTDTGSAAMASTVTPGDTKA